MYLEKIEIQGFKSFAQKTILHFPKESIKNKGITAIVGPNGSGKSNIADAVRWVLGEQSLKMLRGKKSDDVIFSGSEKKARLGFAEVSLYINNEEGNNAIDYSEIVITRRIYRDGEGEYLLNKNKVRLQDIQILLAKAQIGQRTYSVVGQGMIDYFLIAPPQERKEFFDEAAGVKEYQIKRGQSLNKLIAAHENLVKADLLLQEIEPRLKILSRQMKKLEKREILVHELKKYQTDYYGSFKKKFDEDAQSFSVKLSSFQSNFRELDKEISEVESNLNELKLEQSRNEIFESLKNKYSRLMEERNLLLRKQAVIKANKEIEYKKVGKINLIWLEKKYDEIKKEKDNISSNLALAETTINDLKEKAKRANDEKHLVENKRLLVEEKLSALQLSLLPKEINSGELSAELSLAYDEYKDLLKKIEKVKDIAELEDIKKSARNIDIKFEGIISKISKKNNENKDELNILKEELNKVLQEKEKVILLYNNLMIEINTKRERERAAKESLEKIDKEEKNILKEISEAKIKPGEKDNLNKLEEENAEIEKDIFSLDIKIKSVSEEINEFNKKEELKKERFFTLQRQYQEKQQVLSHLTAQINEIKINLAKIETKKEDLENEIRQEDVNLNSGFDFNNAPEDLIPHINRVKSQLEIIGGIDSETQNEYKETKERFEFLSTQTDDLRKAINSLEKIINELDSTIKIKFEASFNKINEEFQKYFKNLFSGGNAKLLRVEDNEEEKEEPVIDGSGKNLEENEEDSSLGSLKEKNLLKQYKQKSVWGIEIQAVPPGKKVSNINMLSGGERTLTAIALLCAIISNNPSPFIILDEVDAALDEANSYKLSKILDELSHKSQFIVITHNRATMHKAELLYGVTMGDEGVSKLLSIKFEDAEKTVKK